MSGVPDWCLFFTEERFQRFCDRVDDACAMFGADGQDLAEGSVELATGAGQVVPFSLVALAELCQGRPEPEWAGICDAQIDAWSIGAAQYRWLERAPLDRVRGSLRVWLSDGHHMFAGLGRDDPREPCTRRLAAGLWVGAVARGVPSDLPDEPELDIEVHNAAVRAWGIDSTALIELGLVDARRNPPVWSEIALGSGAGRGRGWRPRATRAVRALRGSGAVAAGWAPLLPELLPSLPLGDARHGVLVAVPCQETLLLCAVPRDADREAATEAMAAVTQDVSERTCGIRISDAVYSYEGGAFDLVRARRPLAEYH